MSTMCWGNSGFLSSTFPLLQAGSCRGWLSGVALLHCLPGWVPEKHHNLALMMSCSGAGAGACATTENVRQHSSDKKICLAACLFESKPSCLLLLQDDNNLFTILPQDELLRNQCPQNCLDVWQRGVDTEELLFFAVCCKFMLTPPLMHPTGRAAAESVPAKLPGRVAAGRGHGGVPPAAQERGDADTHERRQAGGPHLALHRPPGHR